MQEFAAEFKNEMGVMLKLRHPNLVSLLHIVTREEPNAMALEYLPGGDMSDWLQWQGNRASGEDLVFLLHQVACGMAELASRAIGKPGSEGNRGSSCLG